MIVYADEFDATADQQILECLSSDEFSNMMISYHFGRYTYPLCVIHNPNKELLMGDKGDFSEPITSEIIAISYLPVEVMWHLQRMFPMLKNEYKEFIVNLSGNEHPNKYKFLKPVYVAVDIDDSYNNEILTKTLSSSKFENAVLYYQLDNEYYRVRVLYNPQEHAFKTSKKFRLDHFKPAEDFYLNWSKKYGIAVDKKAPQNLIDYLSQYLNCSWSDWYFNFGVYNGTYIEYTKGENFGPNHQLYTTYQLDTYFNWMGDFVIDENK